MMFSTALLLRVMTVRAMIFWLLYKTTLHYYNEIPEAGYFVKNKGYLFHSFGGSMVWHWHQFSSSEDPLGCNISWQEHMWDEGITSQDRNSESDSGVRFRLL
jgi:hypothetical protein